MIPFTGNNQGIFVFQDPQNRWMPSRSIWNQHSYHITNINDDGTVPEHEQPNWLSYNNYRQNVQGGMDPEDAVANAVNTSGRAVLFAGITVCISVLGMFALGVSFLYGLAVSAAIAVALTMIAALSLLPAMIGLFGRHVLSRREQRKLVAEGPHAPELSGTWGRWARWVQRHKWSSLAASLGVIIVLFIYDRVSR